MDNVLVYIIAAGAAIFIALPFFLRGKGYGDADQAVETNAAGTGNRLRELENARENLYSAIRDIDFDYGLGKLSEEDYRELRDKYRLDAAGVLKQIDAIRGADTPGSYPDLEEEIMRMRKHKSASTELSPEDRLEAEILQERQKQPAQFCTDCGNALGAGDIFCSRCGQKVKEG